MFLYYQRQILTFLLSVDVSSVHATPPIEYRGNFSNSELAALE